MALELVSAAEFWCKLMSRASPGDLGGSRGRSPAQNPGEPARKFLARPPSGTQSSWGLSSPRMKREASGRQSSQRGRPGPLLHWGRRPDVGTNGVDRHGSWLDRYNDLVFISIGVYKLVSTSAEI